MPLDQYGSSEVGHVAGTLSAFGPSPYRQRTGAGSRSSTRTEQPLAPGREGRIVATPFYNLAMPLIRYDMGDYGILSPEPCGCGRTLPVLQRILGRARNVFRFVDGSRKWPLLQSSEVQTFVPNRQWQVVQTAVDRVELRYRPESRQTKSTTWLA